MARDFAQVGVVGLGTMGAGIAEVFAAAGLRVVGVERDDAALEAGRGHLRRSTERAVSRGKLSAEDQAALVGRVTFTTQLDELADVDLVVEAVPERLDIKRELFGRLDAVVRPDAVLATNTSSLSVTEIGASTARAARVVGMHFFNPAPVQRLVEVVRGALTNGDVVEDVTALARRLGKAPVVCGDKAGFVTNALLLAYLNRAAAMYESGHASREDIDAAMTVGCGYPMGPLALLDLIGLDTAYEVLETMHRQSRDRLHAPTPILGQLVSAGSFGRKSGRGFYDYDGAGTDDAGTDDVGGAADVRDVGRVVVVGDGTLAERIGASLRKADLDVAMVALTDPVAAGAGPADSALTEADLVIETAADDLSVKQELFRSLDAKCRPGAVLATTTSLLSVAQCAAATSRPADVVGWHLVDGGGADDAAGGGLVEVVRTTATADDAVLTAADVAGRAGLRAVTCRDRAGFVVDALVVPYLNDAVRMLDAGYATAEDIDTAMKLGCRLPAGPFELLDEMGLDAALAIQRRIYRQTPEPGLAPSPLLEEWVTLGGYRRGVEPGLRGSA